MRTLENIMGLVGIGLAVGAEVYSLGFGVFALGIAIVFGSMVINNNTRKI